ncbi:helix-turn-helix domain-containing protein [Silanimonas sp.]|uniref:helix-turn-helix transcriptional regulator n=1 Tax=Silanimonas sp. TaxID=1929290 RepID=UPI0022CAEF9A|nr:helix-turn-helix domain-containing protein [Silanimonas sp.]MCZ8166660.1 helix-turn-helix domain-containing protein [Silanimonas sp.]
MIAKKAKEAKPGRLASRILKRVRENAGLDGPSAVPDPAAVVSSPPKRRGPAKNADSVSLDAARALRRLGNGLRIARKARRLTQAQVAKRAGIGRKAVMALEAGTGTPSLAAFAEVMAVIDPDLLPVLCDMVESERTTRALLEMRLPATVRHAKRFTEAPRR